MSRVKRAQRGEEIVINRDEGDEVVDDSSSPEEKAERGESDLGTLSMFGAPEAGVVGAGMKTAASGSSGEASGNSSTVRDDDGEKDVVDGNARDAVPGEKQERVEESKMENTAESERKRKAARDLARENDDNPPKNILADLGADESDGEADKEEYRHRKRDKLLAAAHGERGGSAGMKGMGKASREERDDEGGATMERRTTADSYREGRYCQRGETTAWQDGRKVSDNLSSPALLGFHNRVV